MTMQALISACEKGGRLDQALKAYADMLEAGMQPDMITYSNLLTGTSSICVGRVSGGNEQSVQPVLLRQLQPLLQESNPTDGALALSAAACEKHNELGKALDLLEKMHLAGFAGSPPNYASIITQARPPPIELPRPHGYRRGPVAPNVVAVPQGQNVPAHCMSPSSVSLHMLKAGACRWASAAQF